MEDHQGYVIGLLTDTCSTGPTRFKHMQPLEERVVPYATRLSEEAKTLSPGTVREAIEQRGD